MAEGSEGVGAAAKTAYRGPLDNPSPLIMWKWLYYLICGILRILFRFWGHWHVVGRERVPWKGAFIAAANHVSYVDPPLLGVGIVRPAYFIAKEELFTAPVLSRVIPRLGAFPVKRGAADRAAMKRALEILKRGEPLAIFPEGTRREPGEITTAESGFGWIVLKSRAPVLPVALINSHELLPREAKFLQPSRVKVIIGEPLPLDDVLEWQDTRAAIREIGERTMRAIRELQHQAASGAGKN